MSKTSENVTVVIHNSNVQNGGGCGSGCGTIVVALIVLALVGSVIESCGGGDAEAKSSKQAHVREQK